MSLSRRTLNKDEKANIQPSMLLLKKEVELELGACMFVTYGAQHKTMF